MANPFGKIATLFSGSGWLRTKTVEQLQHESEEPAHQLNRALGPVQLTLFGIGAIIGAGIFAIIGTAAAGDTQRPGAGPALMLSFVVTAFVCGFTAVCYAEFAAMVPISGSAYTYAYASLGELIAWIIGWDLIIEYAVGNIAVAISWANYFKTLIDGLLQPFGREIPAWLAMDYRTAAAKQPAVLESAPHIFGVPIVFNLLAILIIVAVTAILVVGIRESAWFNAAMVCIKIVVLTFFIGVGTYWVKPDNWQPFAPNGFAGISAGAAIVFFAYIGFDAVSTVAEETRNPQRNLPLGILASLAICTVFYVVVSVVFTGMISYPDLREVLTNEQAEPLTLAMKHVGAPHWQVGILAFGSVVAHTAVLLVFQLGQPRIFMAMARDGLLPPIFARVHPRFRTPHVATILTGVFVASFAAVASIDEMVDLTNIGTLFAFILVCAGIVVLRVKDPDRPRPFRAPGGLVLPILGIISCLYLIYYLPPTSWLRFAAWLNLGLVIYVGYGTRHSRLRADTAPVDDERAGLWLAVAGILMLVFTHSLDLMLAAMDEAVKQDAALSFVIRLGIGMNAVLSPAGWLGVRGFLSELFWFWLLPLGLNAFVLCPIIIRRTVRAGRERGETRLGTLLGASALLALVSLYFIVLLAVPHG